MDMMSALLFINLGIGSDSVLGSREWVSSNQYNSGIRVYHAGDIRLADNISGEAPHSVEVLIEVIVVIVGID